MELQRSKKIKHPKIRELSPPPSVLTANELEGRFTDAGEHQPSTLVIAKEVKTKEIGSEDISANGESVPNSEEKIDETVSMHKSSTESEKIGETEKTIECDEKPDTETLSEMKKEQNVESVMSTCTLVSNIYPTPTTIASSSLVDSKEAAKTDSEVKDIASSIYPNMQLNEMKATSSQKTDELSTSTYSEGVQERDITNLRLSPPLSSEIKNNMMGERIANVYPSLFLECNEYGLLTENQLLTFYQNELYEAVEEFVDEFLEHEEFPQHNLHEYLERYKKVCEHIDAKEIDIMDCEQLVKGCAQASWTAENRVIKQEGRCGEQKYATGSATYLVATFHPEKVTELSRLLKRDATSRLDSSLSLQIQMRSLALQIQWRIIEYNSAFMMEHCCNIDSPPCFLAGNADTVSRRNLRNALSDLFHYLRYPDLSSRFISAVSGWISELVAVLLKACTSSDQQYLLCQVLRLVSPVSQWAAPLLQSFIEIDSMNDRLIVDNYIVMMSLLLSSVRGRENFLQRIINFENESSTWVVINDDGAEKDGSLVTVNETDLIAFLNQFSAEAAFAKAIRCFAITLRSDPITQALTLIAFELVLLKIFNDGLYAYGTSSYRQFCKQIGYALRQSVICSAEFLKVIKDMLSVDEAEIVQKEFDRIILHAVYYIVSKQNLGLLQFVVDLPYDFASEKCRMRCQLLLRRKMTITIAQLYEFPDEDLPNLVEKAGSLFDKLPDLPGDDRIYMISTLAAIISASDSGVDSFTVEILNLHLLKVCFLDVSMRDHFYKAGAETIGILIDKHPYILQKILLFIDRNLDSLDEYAVEVLSIAPLSKCRLSVDDVGIICGKWRVLGSMNWGTDESGKLWLQPEVHIVCADTLVKGHMAQCKATNGLISKSWNKVAKLASKVPDYEHQFDAFCWDILVRLKLPLQADALNIQSVNDLASFFVFVIQRSLLSVDEFLSSGLSLWSELITSGCYVGSVVILARLMSSFPDAVTTLISHEIFTQCFDRLLLCDLSSYAVQLIAGASKFPGPTVRLLGSAITYHINENFSQVQISGWIQLLCCKRSTQWNTDKSTLYLLGILVRIAFARDQTELLGIPELLKTNYAVLLQQRKDESKGVLSWFTSDDSVPPLIDSVNLDVSPWASVALLLAEQRSHEAFYEALYQAMSKYPKNSLDQSVKKAASKSHVNIPIERLHFHRWLQFACIDNIREHPVFSLILQNLAIHLYSRKIYLSTKFCFGEKYLTSLSSKSLFEELRGKILPQMEYGSEKGISLFYKAIAQWLSNPKICSISFHAFDNFLLDHLLQFIVANDFHPWLEYINMNEIRKKISDEQKLYIFVCHLGSLVVKPPVIRARNLTQLIAQFSKRCQALPYPVIPLHSTLPREIPFDLSIACNSRHCLMPYASYLKGINEAARIFVSAKDQVEILDNEYVGYYPDLYTKSTAELDIVLKCGTVLGSKCANPVTSTVIVAASRYQTPIETKMKVNRQKRSDELASIFSKLFEQTSLHCANLENIVIKMHNYMEDIDSLSTVQAKLLRDTGRILFYHSTSSITSLEMIFPAVTDSYGFVLAKLGKAFISDNPLEQHNLMRVILSGSHLAHLLTPYFTPHCVPAAELLNLYTSLSKAVRDPITSPPALALLSQLDIKNAGDRLPPHQFSQLMPAAFENLISISDTSLPLYDVCARHFIHSIFHRFPSNFNDGLKLALAACDTKSTPACIFDEIIKKLGVDKVGVMDNKPEHIIDTITASIASEIVAAQFRRSRNELSTRFYNVWVNYLPKVLHLVQFFLYSAASLSFNPEQPTEKLESELRQVFESCIQVFGPLLEQFGPGLPPWNPTDADSAVVVLDYFVSLVEQLHLLYDTYFPPGSENLITLFWRYYAEKLAFFTRGGSYVHQIIESRFINIPWHLFWPSLYDLSSMDKIMVDGAPESAPLITQIVVRVPWLLLIQYQAQQPLDAHRAFYSLLFSLLASCISHPSNYTICRASLPKLMNSLGPFPWHLIDVEQLNIISSRIASTFSSVVLVDPDDVTNAFFELHRRICFFGTFPADFVSDAEICQKQSFYVRTQLALMLGNSNDKAWLKRFYEDQIKVVHSIVSSPGLTLENQVYLSHELTSFWSDISDSKFLEVFSSTLLQWLEKNSNSSVVLLLMNTIISSLKMKQNSAGLQIIEKCIATYFESMFFGYSFFSFLFFIVSLSRYVTLIKNVSLIISQCHSIYLLLFFQGIGLCEWNVVLKWTALPDVCGRILFTSPSSENNVLFLPLCANTFIMKQLTSMKELATTPLQQENSLLRTLLDYVTTIKPRYVTNEAAFLLLMEKLQKLLLRQYNYSVMQANQLLMQYLEWLERTSSDDKSSSFFSLIGFSKRHPYSIKMRYICHLMNLYISQQTISLNQPPRNTGSAPVLNCRMQSFKELCAHKQYIPFQTTSQLAQPYFIQVQIYHISHVSELFAHVVRSLYSEKYLEEMLANAAGPY
uniref:Ectopic P granules protein 5 homolog n=1 Tax=Elaeophora elaphi TaxID=1147741 RepID=A0A158Q6Q3_9BILA